MREIVEGLAVMFVATVVFIALIYATILIFMVTMEYGGVIHDHFECYIAKQYYSEEHVERVCRHLIRR